jgi:peptide deformylase
MILKIVKFDEEVLRQETHLVEFPLSAEVKKLIKDMMATMHDANGRGLAAPQVNRSERIFVVNDGNVQRVFVNPSITKRWGSVTLGEEECLSLPGTLVNVPRHKFIKVIYYNEDGKELSGKFRTIDARVIQHEYDHLEGKVITDYVKREKGK